MAAKKEPERTIREVMEKGSWVRKELTANNVHPDPANWSGLPGVTVAMELVEEAAKLPEHPDPAVAEARAAFIDNCSRILGATATPEAITA